MKFNFKVPSISKKRNELNYDHSHTLTHNFGVHQIISALDIIPNSDLTVDLSAFTRLTPLPCPTYGGVKVNHRAYFVPFEFCLKGFNDFVSFQKGTSLVQGQTATAGTITSHFKIPYFTVEDILKCICQKDNIRNIETFPSTEYTEYTGPSASVWDLCLKNDDTYTTVRYTTKGRKLVSWLAQLGYKLPPATMFESQLNKRFDCLALFAFWKYYLDWVVPARFVLTIPRFVYIKSVLDTLEWNTRTWHLTYHSDFAEVDYPSDLDLSQFLMVPTAFLDDDHYTTSFVTPYGVENDSSSIPFVSGLSFNSTQVGSSSPSDVGTSDPSYNGGQAFLGNGYGINSNVSNNGITELSLLSLGRLQQLVNKKKITSTNVLDFLRSTYGIAPSHDVMRLSSYLGNFDSQIMIGDVMATATTDSSQGTTVVGQYAGKGIGGSSAKWRINSPMHGIMFITSDVTTKSSYVNGVSPLRSRFEPLDFFNELFDNVGVRAVRHDELIQNTFETFDPETITSIPAPDSIFGFQPRYSEYKFKDDMVSGDFMFPSVNKGLDSWYLNRKFKINEDPKIGLEFCSATSDSVGSQYDRIFQNTDNVDHFYSVYNINVHETSIKEKLFDYFKTLNETDADKNDQDVTIN